MDDKGKGLCELKEHHSDQRFEVVAKQNLRGCHVTPFPYPHKKGKLS